MSEYIPDVPEHNGFHKVVLELAVANHPGVMSHICGLFARRAFNVEGILCMPVGSGDTSRIWLLVFEDQRLEKMIRQVEKLEDVQYVKKHDGDHPVFGRLDEFFQ
ncbi:acetolactate synthase small subunit [Zoogloea sp.]|uniref:acetolactate synthase small subunit n=1 Tax=Zoogloea sp. TaxID=49181 RepID=UPI0035B4E018